MMIGKFVFACVLAMVAMFGTLVASDQAEARRYRGESGWTGGTGEATTYRQVRSRSVRSSRSARYSRNLRSHRSIRSTRSARSHSVRSHRVARATRHYRGGLETASLTGSGVGARPRQWCGWWMRTQLGGGPAYNLAWNWRNYGSPSSAQVGAVVIWRHHVGMITGQASNGQWIVKSGNDGGRVRERARSVSGAIFRI